MKIPVLTSTLQLREEFEQEVRRTVGLLYIEDLSWPGLGVVRYIFQYFLLYVWINSAVAQMNRVSLLATWMRCLKISLSLCPHLTLWSGFILNKTTS